MRSYVVFPTHVGVFLRGKGAKTSRWCLPHARGGVSKSALLAIRAFESSPRTWGCFCPDLASIIPGRVFPTHVGVFPSTAALLTSIRSLPHARGGVSAAVFRPCACLASSPRTWGCFLRKPKNRTVFRVFPTHVGVFLASVSFMISERGLPHARGGVSSLEAELAGKGESSPRTWGCFR